MCGLHYRRKFLTESVPGKDLLENLLDKKFKTIVLKIIKELKKDMKKIKKNDVWSIHPVIENLKKKLKRNSNNSWKD